MLGGRGGWGASGSAKRTQIVMEEGSTYYMTQIWEGNSTILLVKLIKLVLLMG